MLDVMAVSEDDLKMPGTWANFFSADFLEFYVDFLHHQTLCQIDQRGMQAKMKDAEGDILKLFTPSDEANAVFQYINNHKKWGEIAANVDDLDHECHKKREGGIYSKTHGKRKFESGFTDEGLQIYGRILKFVQELRAHDEYPKLQDACKMYFKEDAGGAALRRACTSNLGQVNAVVAVNNTVPREVFVDEDLVESADEGGDASDDDDDEDDDDEDEYGDEFNVGGGYGGDSDAELGGSDDEQEQGGVAREPLPALGGVGVGEQSP